MDNFGAFMIAWAIFIGLVSVDFDVDVIVEQCEIQS